MKAFAGPREMNYIEGQPVASFDDDALSGHRSLEVLDRFLAEGKGQL